MNILTLMDDICVLHRDSIVNWKRDGIVLSHCGILKIIEENHAFNFRLWHAEDRARREDRGFEFVYQAKREIDYCNQNRNNKMEEIDAFMVASINPNQSSDCEMHSETPGMMIDRLSILALKLYHMTLQSERSDVSVEHRDICLHKAKVIAMQQRDLTNCLQKLLHDVVNQTRTFKVYHQFKMYNDPKLNPELYAL